MTCLVPGLRYTRFDLESGCRAFLPHSAARAPGRHFTKGNNGVVRGQQEGSAEDTPLRNRRAASRLSLLVLLLSP